MNSSLSMIIDDVCTVFSHQAEFWRDGGWAPAEASELLQRSRLDRQVGLARCLKLWLENARSTDSDAKMILAWANLGALVEGSLKLFLTIHLNDYSSNPVRRWSVNKQPPELMLEEIRNFFHKHVWTEQQDKIWNKWLSEIRNNRNSIHAFADRSIGNYSEFSQAVNMYRDLLGVLEGQTPYPDDYFTCPAAVAEVWQRVLRDKQC